MIRNFCQWMLYKHLGWKKEVTFDLPKKYIICLAPHTSNWDLFLGQLFEHAEGMKCNFLMKKEWFFWPLGCIFRRMGGIAVTRNKKTSLTDQLAEKAKSMDRFELAVTPEGTRSLVTTWKRGFYFIALKAKLPIMLYAIDYDNKTVICNKTIMPSGDVEADMRLIMDYYRPYKGKYPGKFAVEEIPSANEK